MKCTVEIGLKWHDIHTKIRGDLLRYLSNMTVITATLRDAAKLVLLRKRFVEYAAEMDSCGTFMKIDTGVEAILRFFLGNLRGCNAGITEGRDL
jgi:hypothetical protein